MIKFGLGFLAGVAVSAVAALAYAITSLTFDLKAGDEAGIAKWNMARLIMLEDAASRGCLTQQNLIDAATAQGWTYRQVGLEEDWLYHGYDNPAALLNIDTRPGLPFDKQPGDIYGFDAEGCMLGP